jgi:hypothetical protein
MAIDVSVEIHCGRCGSANYSLPEGESADSRLLCNDCGDVLGTVGALQAELSEQALARSAERRRGNLGQVVDQGTDSRA